ncbi:Transcription factor bHLH144 [Striga hermonthica]|uniref:Transcription factor bHLH144 n=1 Tax=Striga hermonthica TaxID=68872 RepID=A0A9N7NEK6_STRHE|nr:Transcription factor bHLH144 [Striga hermonthica]
MHTGQPFFPENPNLPFGLGDQKIGYYTQNAPMAAVLNGFVPPGIKPRTFPFHNVNVQPSNACPRNFIIFDQTNKESQVMYNPEMSSKFLQTSNFEAVTPFFRDELVQKDPNANSDHNNISSSFEEDYNDIDALLSSEYEENEIEDDEVSTARNGVYYDCSSPDSCSNYEPVPKKKRTVFGKSSGIRGNEKKKKHNKRMKKMVKALRGIVPGANRMTAVEILDESVRYLKSLRAEVQKLGVESFEG